MAILSIGLAIYVVNVAVTRQAEDELRRRLEDAATLVDQNRDVLFEQFAREARLIADLPKLKAAVGVNHPPTMQPIAEDYQAQIGSDVFVVTNAQGDVLAQIGQVDLPADRVARLSPIKTALMGSAAACSGPGKAGTYRSSPSRSGSTNLSPSSSARSVLGSASMSSWRLGSSS